MSKRAVYVLEQRPVQRVWKYGPLKPMLSAVCVESVPIPVNEYVPAAGASGANDGYALVHRSNR